MVLNIEFNNESVTTRSFFSFSVSTLTDAELLSFGRSIAYYLVESLGIKFDDFFYIERVWYDCTFNDIDLPERFVGCGIPRSEIDAGVNMCYTIDSSDGRRFLSVSEMINLQTHIRHIINSIKKQKYGKKR